MQKQLPGRALEASAVREYVEQFSGPHVLEATCGDYRAGATVDIEGNRADRDAARKIACPTLVLWGRQYLRMQSSDVLDAWRDWADEVSELSLDCGHFPAQEEPNVCASAMRNFFSS